MAKPDSKLVRGCLSGRRQAWETLVHRYDRLIYGIVLRFGLSQDDAADIFQTVCVKLLSNMQNLKDDKHLTGWLITTTKHECLHALRHKGHQNNSRTIDLYDRKLDGITDDDPLPIDTVLEIERNQQVHVAVEDLTGRCRKIIELLYLADPPASYAEVSQRLEVPLGAIGPTRSRCLKNLKEKLLKLGF